ncbi:pyridoxamine 5'-phosphate oxidase family protein [Antarctobacter jejuensis]|uniref:pyridoxamine 5'-phosphate oxidase family protein n=1 Tax=Antarctobacter jejuensis TaxID=1439938 RepID=UPI003FCFBB2A
MGTQYPALTDALTGFIAAQHIFFVATAAEDGRVNLSPKGMDSLRVMGPNRIVWRNLTGSGNETAGHLARVNRMTLMWCGFEKQPMILRAYGSARTLHPRDAEFAELNADFPPSVGARQIYDVTLDLVQSSCGYAVPFYDYAGEREVLKDWADRKGEDGVRDYWATRNLTTIDGMPTGITAEPET